MVLATFCGIQQNEKKKKIGDTNYPKISKVLFDLTLDSENKFA